MKNWSKMLFAACCAALLATPALMAQGGKCAKVTLNGEVAAGHEWRAGFGQGWVFRVVPIQGSYSGWDLVVDREPAAGYPDALLLATPPYNSINEREVGTTFRLRAQDALGWNPRSFHFYTDPADFAEAQGLFKQVDHSRGPNTPEEWHASVKLLGLATHASAGEFHILDAHLAPGTADAAPFAENWALRSEKTPHSVEPASGSAAKAKGEFHWMKFSVTLWLPAGWKTPPGVASAAAVCGK